LSTINAELNGKVEELDRANNVLRNLFESTEIATVFLDANWAAVGERTVDVEPMAYPPIVTSPVPSPPMRRECKGRIPRSSQPPYTPAGIAACVDEDRSDANAMTFQPF
jgi:hypothetical protein